MKVVQRRMNGKKLAPRCNGAKKRRTLKNREEWLVKSLQETAFTDCIGINGLDRSTNTGAHQAKQFASKLS